MATRALWVLGALTAFVSLSSTVFARDPELAPLDMAWAGMV